MASKITTPEGFREAIDDLDALLDSLSADQAAGLADEIKGAAYKASKRFSGDDLEDTLIKVDALKNRLRRRWKRQRRSNIGGALLGAAFTGASGVLVKFAAEVPPWAIVVLFFIGVAFGLVAATSLASSTDWRDEVARPVGEVADILAKALAEKPEAGAPYRDASEDVSTRTRAAPTIAEEEQPADAPQGDERQRHR